MEFSHIPVMLEQCIDGLDIKPDGVYVDCTLGGGGHSEAIVSRLHSGRLIAIDKDSEAILAASARLERYASKISYVHDDFKNFEVHLDELGVSEIDGILMDLGVSSYQLDNAERGMSYKEDGPLDMRMDSQAKFSAFDVVNGYEEKELARVIWQYGEERYSRKIAAAICRRRKEQAITTTSQLAEIVSKCFPPKERYGSGNPCKRTFQAIRIEVNSELDGLSEMIKGAARRLKSGGRICVITFHSLEDRIVKQTFNYLSASCICPAGQPICTCDKKKEIEIISRKPIVADDRELEANKRAGSAKLRIAQKI
ncbi:MAG: 16S rRNA (cytosine(1402)-N(4))-methyltransferase RsmH [Clostridia bacterium]|nr:16S rRNA (cytosine(1402)-N(4))-methyltransferase RsmH [Clostridia bacterium]